MTISDSQTARSGPALAERRQLVSVAFRLLGTIAEAEDAVQEAYLRWYRLADGERERILNPGAWLTRVVGRICLDVLGSARVRRERYVGEWLPEPVPAGAFPTTADDPLERVALADSVSTAILVLLETMTPAERVAFVLHDVFQLPFAEVADVIDRSPAACRQLAASARARVGRSPARQVTRAEHDRVVRAFAAAAEAGEIGALVGVLDPAAVLRSDGGGHVTAARRPVTGADRVARFLLGIRQKWPAIELHPVETADGLGFAGVDDGRVVAVGTLGVVGGVVTDVRIVVNPEKLGLWAVDRVA
ncbi:RNA polymerase sigma factor SigJ [Frondihabitans australicus]|uniref:RNA polymerase sigma-70 factor (ECF subfamily) n=1 Tax=Frondihabitans australicus TaxID=386892 RepID=A0A495IIW2_9MICO|nr:RNA polymerase sigma factor SigJ [Frondihabitans australicus]RKR75046.1 RNA polymerase sigma-70 factor (ECF subfamily) [Frondihabitans australicus]